MAGEKKDINSGHYLVPQFPKGCYRLFLLEMNVELSIHLHLLCSNQNRDASIYTGSGFC